MTVRLFRIRVENIAAVFELYEIKELWGKYATKTSHLQLVAISASCRKI